MLTVGIASSDAVSSAQIVAALQQTGMAQSIKEWTLPAVKTPDMAEGVPDIVLLDLGRDADPFFAF